MVRNYWLQRAEKDESAERLQKHLRKAFAGKKLAGRMQDIADEAEHYARHNPGNWDGVMVSLEDNEIVVTVP